MKIKLIFSLVTLIFVSVYAFAASEATLIPPPAINVPYGGILVTEINLSNDNVLGLIKQTVLAATDIIKSHAAAQSGTDAPRLPIGPQEAAFIASIDVKGLIEAFDGIKAVRVVIVQYSRRVDSRKLMAQFDQGVAKLGNFSKVISDTAFFPGATAIYAESGNAGYIAYGYDPCAGTLYAARVMGSVDIPKLIEWSGNVLPLLLGMQQPPALPQDTPAP